jgi:hypothetical protein
VLNDNAEYRKFIETVGKSGYRWIAPITLRSDTLQPGGTFLPTYIYGWPDSISSGHTNNKNQGTAPIPDPGPRSLTGLSCRSNVVESQNDKSLRH